MEMEAVWTISTSSHGGASWAASDAPVRRSVEVFPGFDENTWDRFFPAGSRGEGERRRSWLEEKAAGGGTTPADRGWTRGGMGLDAEEEGTLSAMGSSSIRSSSFSLT
jgi:hypothetical protein